MSTYSTEKVSDMKSYRLSPLEKVETHIFCLCDLLIINSWFS